MLCWGSGTPSSILLPWARIFIIVLPMPAVPVSDGTRLENHLRARLAELPSAFAASHLFYLLIVQFTATSSNFRTAYRSPDISIFPAFRSPKSPATSTVPWHEIHQLSTCSLNQQTAQLIRCSQTTCDSWQSLFQCLQKEQRKFDLQSSEPPKDCISKLRSENLF